MFHLLLSGGYDSLKPKYTKNSACKYHFRIWGEFITKPKQFGVIAQLGLTQENISKKRKKDRILSKI
jgi:hypothetical protein